MKPPPSLHEPTVPTQGPGSGADPGATSTWVAADGDGYERAMGRWSRRLADPFLDFVGLPADERVLDVGCGTGALAQTLARRVPDATIDAVDLSPACIEHARRRSAGADRIRYAVGDACALGYDDRRFDHVLSLLLLHFVPDAARVVAEMRRVARPGATIGAAVWDTRGGGVAQRLFFDTAAALDPQAVPWRARHCTQPMTRPGELAAAWRAGGLEQVAEATLLVRTEFLHFDDYWEPCELPDSPAAGYLASLTAARRKRLREAVQRAYLDGEPDGPRSYAALAWAVKGTVPAR